MFGLFKKQKDNIMLDDVGVTQELRVKLKKKLIKEEGTESKPYYCTEQKLSIGVGRNLEAKGLKQQEIDYLLSNDIEDVFLELNKEIPDWKYHPLNIRLVLCDMTFNMGIKGVLKFKNFLSALDDGDYESASKEILDSKYAMQLPKRARRNSELVMDEA